MTKDILTTHEAAKYINVTMPTVVNWIDDGSLKAYKTKGGHRRIKKDDLVDFLKKYNMPAFSKERILVVDDDASIRIGLKKVFQKEGYEVDLASDGFEAGVLIEKGKPALVVLDLIMPNLDGFSVCQYIRSLDGLKHTKIIVLTGYPSKENFSKAKKAGADLCLAKPVQSEELLNEVETLLGTSVKG